MTTSDLIKQLSVPLGQVSVVPKGCQQRQIHVFRKSLVGRSGEKVLLVLIGRLKLDEAIVRKLKQETCELQ